VVDLYSPIDGRVVQINPGLHDDLSLINLFPLCKGWIAVLKVKNIQQLESLLTEEDYQAWICEEE